MRSTAAPAGSAARATEPVFHRLRGAADAILVAAGTARAERYRRPQLDDAAVRRRRAHGLTDHPRLVIVSASLHLPDDLPLLQGPGEPSAGPAPRNGGHPRGSRRGRAACGSGPPSWTCRQRSPEFAATAWIVLLCEGGPSLLGQLHREGLLDELFVTFSPKLVGGSMRRPARRGHCGDSPDVAAPPPGGGRLVVRDLPTSGGLNRRAQPGVGAEGFGSAPPSSWISRSKSSGSSNAL